MKAIEAINATVVKAPLQSLPRISRIVSASAPFSTTTQRRKPPNDPLFRFYKLAQQNIRPPHSTFLITGGLGQLGRSLASILKYMYGPSSVILSDISKRPEDHTDIAPFCYVNVLDRNNIEEMIVNYNVDTLIHFSALLSAVGENNVPLALDVNVKGAQNILEVARAHRLKVFIPSTIGAFGPETPRVRTPDLTIQRPKTIYGVTKVFAELLGEYYNQRFGLDFRSLRFPGIISNVKPGGGTTDYAIQIFYDALLYGRHKCYLKPDTELPMMYDTDCMASVVQLLFAPDEALSLRTYNVTGFSFTPEEIADGIRKHIPNFEMIYDICPMRQQIADSWPQSLDDSCARRDWGWSPEYDLQTTVETMLEMVAMKLKQPPGSVNTTTTSTPLPRTAAM